MRKIYLNDIMPVVLGRPTKLNTRYKFVELQTWEIDDETLYLIGEALALHLGLYQTADFYDFGLNSRKMGYALATDLETNELVLRRLIWI